MSRPADIAFHRPAELGQCWELTCSDRATACMAINGVPVAEFCAACTGTLAEVLRRDPPEEGTEVAFAELRR